MKLDSLNQANKDYFLFNSNLPSDKRNRSSYSVKSQFLSVKPIKIKACFMLNFSHSFSIKQLNERQSLAVLMQASFKSNPLFSSKEHDIAIDDRISDVISSTKLYLMNRK